MEEAKKEKELKKNKKKNKVASLLLALALVLTCGVAGTIAQYQKSLGGTSTATVAKFKVSAGSLNEDKSATFELFKTRKDSYTESDTEKVHGTGDENVDSEKIAPGTWGYYPVTLTNDSEVSVYYQLYAKWSGDDNTHQVTYTSSDGEKTVDVPLKFALYKSDTAPTSVTQIGKDKFKPMSAYAKPDSSDETMSNTLGSKTKGSNTANVYLCWVWEYENEDETDKTLIDTATGEAMANSSTLSPTVEIGVTFTQKD